MKILNLIVAVAVLACLPSLPMARDILEQKEPAVQSIHQLDWERHRDEDPSPATFSMQSFQTTVEPAGDLVPRETSPDKEVFGYLPYWGYKYRDQLNYDLLTTIAYFGLKVNGRGEIVNAYDWPATDLINRAHKEGVRVVPTVILFDPDEITALLESAENRTRLVENLLRLVKQANADGVTIDFEGVRSDGDQREQLVAFMTELSSRFHTDIPNSYVTIFTPAVDWRSVYDYESLARVTDGLIMQGYDFHWSTAPTAGPVAPLTGSRWGNMNVTRTVDDYVDKTSANVDKLILSVPFYGLEWKTEDDGLESPTLGSATSILYHTAYPNGDYHGRLWDRESRTPWYKYVNGTQWHQGWYDDAESLKSKLDLIRDKDLQGAAIWALTYDGDRRELQETVADAFGSTLAPMTPDAARVRDVGSGIEVAVEPSDDAVGYQYYASTDGVHFQFVRYFPGASYVFRGLRPDEVYYFKVTAVNAYGESRPTRALAASHRLVDSDLVLVVDGVTSDEAGTEAIRRMSESLRGYGASFDSVDHSAIEQRRLNLEDYAAVVWISGEENSQTDSFNLIEQGIVATYLEYGGRLFVSGSEIGFDLSQKGSVQDRRFYREYLKAEYIQDKVEGYSARGVAGSLFESIGTVKFDDGTHGTYDVDYPDGIKPVDGSKSCMDYEGNDSEKVGGACIQYHGLFGESRVPGGLVYLAFPLESAYPVGNRQDILSTALRRFDISAYEYCEPWDFWCHFRRWFEYY